MKTYTSFDEINRDLKYLKLKSQIDQEELKLGLHHTKDSFKESLSPMNMIASTIGAVAKKAFVYKAVDWLVGMKPVKKEEYEE
ncbi:DUF6327 family protein [Cochleicola gelatinilyticus]|uniref:Glutaminyl-tRNA synthetase n=1 Tax=Cochleicola gelatinilyticus TaxID=1763537 RepID=A0A167J1R8_9FLAO|nr:DUF6327 family protein [Cochleicola gelatinilyticus]OAB80245.1 hypothetical protein ULVI_05780 [Cochleicola gelatinilyticus]